MQVRAFIIASLGAFALNACDQIAPNTSDTVAHGAVSRGQHIYAKECSQCHGTAGEGGGPASLGLGLVPPDLIGLSTRNGGTFPRTFVRQYILGLTEKNDLVGPMPDFGRVGLRHVYPKGGYDGEVPEAGFEGLLDYLEVLQE